ncbi:MAG: hypothetical protein ACYCTE_16195 [Acidimicrobiales bacterium]
MAFVAVLWLAASAAVGYAGAQRGRGGMNWFLLALLICPLLAVLVLLACPVQGGTERRASTWRIADVYRPGLTALLGLIFLVRGIGTALYSPDPLSYSVVPTVVGLSLVLGAAWLLFARRGRHTA